MRTGQENARGGGRRFVRAAWPIRYGRRSLLQWWMNRRDRSAAVAPHPSLAFFDDIQSLRQHCESVAGDLDQRLDDGNGLVAIDDFLPLDVATQVARYVEQGIATEAGWEREESEANAASNDVQFGFNVASGTGSDKETAQRIMRLFHVLGVTSFSRYDDLVPMFDFANYGKRDHIAKHDDRSIVPRPMVDVDGEEFMAPFSRVVAGVLYLSKDWHRSYGGCFVDLESDAPTSYVPKFNRLMLFRVPRWHMVEAVSTDAVRRCSVFGWWLAPGIHYDCVGAEEFGEDTDDEENQDQVKPVQAVKESRSRHETQDHSRKRRRKK